MIARISAFSHRRNGSSVAFADITSTPTTLSGYGITDAITQIPRGKTVYVDSANGNDSTGARGRVDKPFLTLFAAKTAAQSGDLVQVGPGSYTVTASIAKNGVNWNFAPGSSVTRSGGFIFDDGNTAMQFSVLGFGDFHGSENIMGGGVVYLQHTGSSVEFHCRKAESTATTEAGSAVFFGYGNLRVTADEIITHDGDYCVWWRSGDWFINARRIESSSTMSHAIAGDAPAGKKMWINADEIVQSSLSVPLGCVVVDMAATAVVWIFAKEIRAISANTFNPVIDCRNGKLYVTCQKIMAGSSSPFQCSGANSLLYLSSQKVEAGRTGNLSNGQSWIDVLQYLDDGSPTGPMIAVSGGTHNVWIQDMKVAATAVSVTGGTLRLSARVDTSATATGNPVSKSGGTLTLEHCTLVAQSSRDSITAASAQTVVSLGSYANKSAHSNVTVSGSLTVGSYVQ